VSASLQESLEKTLEATDSLADAINANGGHVSRVVTDVVTVLSSEEDLVLGTSFSTLLNAGSPLQLICEPNRFDANGNSTDGCEAGCPAVRSAHCDTCSDPNTCTSLTCETNWFDVNANVMDGCEQGCPSILQALCNTCSDANTCTDFVCIMGFADRDGIISELNGCEAPVRCSGADRLCGCGVDEQIDVDAATGFLSCTPCPAGYHFSAADRVPQIAERS
jgi:hypothetical protein